MGGRGRLEKQSLWLGTGAGPTLARSKACHRSPARETLVTEPLASGVSGEGVGGRSALGLWLWAVTVGPRVSESQTQRSKVAARGPAWRHPVRRPGQLTGHQAGVSKPQNLNGLDSLPRSFLHPTEALIGKEWASDAGGPREDTRAG